MQETNKKLKIHWLLMALLVFINIYAGGTLTTHAIGDSFYGGVSGGYAHAVYVLNDGSVRAVGHNGFGQLGNGSTENQSTPVTVVGVTEVKQVATGLYHTLFLLEDGTVKAVGDNTFGQLGDGTLEHKTTPITVPGLSGVKQISAGRSHSIFLMNDGTVRIVGQNTYGQLGDGTTIDKNEPFLVPGISGVRQVVGGYWRTTFLMEDGTVRVTGRNHYGQLGDGSTLDRHVPYEIPGLSGVKQVTSGAYHTVFLMEDETVKAVGLNESGQLGIGSYEDSLAVIDIPSLSGVQQVSAGWHHTMFRTGDGTVKTVGQNIYGQLTDGTFANKNTPVEVQGVSNVVQISGAGYISAFIMADGTVKVTGFNRYGQIGDGTTTDRATLFTMPFSNMLEGEIISPELIEATLAVETAESTLIQEDVDSARDLVNVLPEGKAKDDLNLRLSTVQVHINNEIYQQLVSAATMAVETAEASETQEDVHTARTLVSGLNSEDRDILNTRLDTVQIIIDAEMALQQAITEATTAVEIAEASNLQSDVDNARGIVYSLPDVQEKGSLSTRLDIVQSIIGAEVAYRILVSEATLAVETLEATPVLSNVVTAQSSVNLLENGDTKSVLLNRIIIQLIVIIEATIASATTVEELEVIEFFFETNETLKDSAPQELMDSIETTKASLSYEPVSASIKEATRMVEMAELTKREPHIQNAIDAVASLDESPEKEALEARILVMQESETALNSYSQRQVERFVKMAEMTKREPHITRAYGFVNAMSPSEVKTGFIFRIESIAESLTEAQLDNIKATQAVEKAETYGFSFLIRTAKGLVEALENETLKADLMDRLSVL